MLSLRSQQTYEASSIIIPFCKGGNGGNRGFKRLNNHGEVRSQPRQLVSGAHALKHGATWLPRDRGCSKSGRRMGTQWLWPTPRWPPFESPSALGLVGYCVLAINYFLSFSHYSERWTHRFLVACSRLQSYQLMKQRLQPVSVSDSKAIFFHSTDRRGQVWFQMLA